jgi:hypothetical protein
VGTIGTLRNFKMAEQLSRYFTQSFLITIKNKPYTLDESPNTDFVERHEVSNYDYRWLFRQLSFGMVSKTRSYKSYLFTQFLIRLADSYPFSLLIGEGGWLYINNAVKLASKLIIEQNITHIYSSFRPTADHVIASKLKRKFKHLIWIADFRDLPVDNNRKNTFFPGYQDRYYQGLIRHADWVLTVSEGLKKRLDAYHPKVLLVRSGLYKSLKNIDMKEKQGKFTMVYTGSIYKEHQDLKTLFTALKYLLDQQLINPEKFQLIYAGMDKYWWEKQLREQKLEKISDTKELLTLSDSIQLQHSSHVNILLSWSGPYTTGVLTGKLYEYLAAGNPILCIVNGMKDAEIETLFRETNAGKVFYTTQENLIRNWVLDLYNAWEETGQVPFMMNKDALEKLDWEVTTLSITEKI